MLRIFFIGSFAKLRKTYASNTILPPTKEFQIEVVIQNIWANTYKRPLSTMNRNCGEVIIRCQLLRLGGRHLGDVDGVRWCRGRVITP